MMSFEELYQKLQKLYDAKPEFRNFKVYLLDGHSMTPYELDSSNNVFHFFVDLKREEITVDDYYRMYTLDVDEDLSVVYSFKSGY